MLSIKRTRKANNKRVLKRSHRLASSTSTRRVSHRRLDPTVRSNVPESTQQTPPTNAAPLRRLRKQTGELKSERCEPSSAANQHLHSSNPSQLLQELGRLFFSSFHQRRGFHTQF